MNKFIKFFSLLAVISALIAAGLILFDYIQTREKFPSQTFLGSANVSGLTRQEAINKLSRLPLSGVFSPQVSFEAEKLVFVFSPSDVGIRINYEATVNQAFAAIHQEGYLKELRTRLKKGETFLPLILESQDQTAKSAIQLISDQIRSTAKDASIVLYEETGGYHIEAEDLGREVNSDETLKAFKARLAEGKTTYPVIIIYTYPKITEKMLRAFPPVNRLSAFTTYYGRHDSPNRIHNIKLMASWLDGTLLLSNESFSLVDAIGDFSPERGFKEAYVIYGGVLVPMLGGGGCQIGTTFYNAIALADLDILSRQNHSFYFNIYPLGRDATIYPGQKDLKFKNNTGHPILIKTVATNKRLSFRVYGTPTGKTVKFTFPSVYLLEEGVGYRSATVREVLDSDRPFKTTVIRTVYDATGNQIKEETINSYYKLYGEKSNVPIARPEPR